MAGLTRRQFIAHGAVAAAAAKASGQKLMSNAKRPNILFILADDMGWGDLSCYGRPDYDTPNLDRLASQGMRFTNAYSAAPVCTPTRVGFFTGRYPARLTVGLQEPVVERKELTEEQLRSYGIPAEHPTVASLIKAAGYSTALIGKWHVGYLPYFSPLKSGFDEFFGNMSGAVDYFTHKDMTETADLFEGEVPVEKIGYLTDLLSDRAVEYVRRRHPQPFYLSLHYTSPHWPWEGPDDIGASKAMKYGPAGFRAGGSLKIYAEMMKNLDDGVGRVLSALKAAGRENDTLVIFTSDNGGERFSYNWPFRGEKLTVYEGGVRVPGIVKWPGVTKRAQVTDQPVITMDWTATMLAAAGAKPDSAYPPDGEDMRQVLEGKRKSYDRTFFWRTRALGAMRSGKWKYIREGKRESLYDLSIDEREQANFAGAEAKRLGDMRSQFDSWARGMIEYK